MAFLFDGDDHGYLINPYKLRIEYKSKRTPIIAFYNKQVDFRKFKGTILLPGAYGNLLIAQHVAHEVRHRFQRINKVNAIVSSDEYTSSNSFFSFLVDCASHDIRRGYYGETAFEEEIDARVVAYIFAREVYMRVEMYDEELVDAVKHCAKIISYDLAQLTELVNSYCWIKITEEA